MTPLLVLVGKRVLTWSVGANISTRHDTKPVVGLKYIKNKKAKMSRMTIMSRRGRRIL